METTPETRPEPAPIAKLAAALAAAQGEFINPPKSKTVHAGAKKYSFAPLPEILDAIRPVLAKHKLAVVQMVSRGALDTRLIHESGQTLGSVYPLPEIADSQAMGSAITYARRYSLCALLGIAAEDDEDGEAATEAEHEAEDAKRQEARKKLDELKAKGHVKSAYTGKPLAPGEDAKPDPAKSEPTTPEPEAQPEKKLAPDLADALKKAGCTVQQFKDYYTGKYTGKRHLPDTTEPHSVPADYLAALLKPENWKKAVTAMKGAK